MNPGDVVPWIGVFFLAVAGLTFAGLGLALVRWTWWNLINTIRKESVK